MGEVPDIVRYEIISIILKTLLSCKICNSMHFCKFYYIVLCTYLTESYK